MRKRLPIKISAFDEKFKELDSLKKEVSRHLGCLNNLRVRYTDWFQRKRQTFMYSIKVIQVSCPLELPTITSISKLLNTVDIAHKIPHLRNKKGSVSPTIQIFLAFWKEMCDLKTDGDILYEKVCVFCDSITRLRDPKLKTKVDDLQTLLNTSCTEDFYFMDTHNEKHNLAFYSIPFQDFQFQGLMGFIPYLLRIATHICYWSTKLYLEKE